MLEFRRTETRAEGRLRRQLLRFGEGKTSSACAVDVVRDAMVAYLSFEEVVMHVRSLRKTCPRFELSSELFPAAEARSLSSTEDYYSIFPNSQASEKA